MTQTRGDFFDTLVAARPDDWTLYTRHRFVIELGSGDLPMACFRTYLLQDYLFLVQFARAYALALFKSRTLADMRAAAAGIAAILDRELDLHVRYCQGWGIDADELARLPEHHATIAYTRYVIDIGLQGDLLDLLVALAPCVVGYADIAAWLAPQQRADRANPYADWIAEYAGAPYQDIANAARRQLDELSARTLAPGRFEEVADIFARACRLEADFWQMGLDA